VVASSPVTAPQESTTLWSLLLSGDRFSPPSIRCCILVSIHHIPLGVAQNGGEHQRMVQRLLGVPARQSDESVHRCPCSHTNPEPPFFPHSRRFGGPTPGFQREGFTHILTIIYRSTRWLEAVPLCSTMAASCANAITAGWVSRFGVPDHLTTNRGAQFTSQLWSAFTHRLGIRHHLTTAFHSQSNGMEERVHHQIKDALGACTASDDWPNHLPWVLLGIRTAPKDNSGLSSAELLYGAPLSLPGQLPIAAEAPPLTFNTVLPPELRLIPPLNHSYPEAATATPHSLLSADYVFISRGSVSPPLPPPYSCPFKVVSRSSKAYVIDVGGGKEVVSIDRLQPHTRSTPLVVVLPPKCCRPAASPLVPALPAGLSPGPG